MTRARRLQPSEYDDQVALFEWAALARSRFPELNLLHHIPNGGSRHPKEAARLKAAGVKSGVPDCCLPVPRGAIHGFYLELKSARGEVSASQQAWICALKNCGYRVSVCFGFDQAVNAITDYLSMESEMSIAPGVEHSERLTGFHPSLADRIGQVDVVPLETAVLCIDCNQITSSDSGCRICGSSSVLGLAGILNRTQQ